VTTTPMMAICSKSFKPCLASPNRSIVSPYMSSSDFSLLSKTEYPEQLIPALLGSNLVSIDVTQVDDIRLAAIALFSMR
jgi:hypothetical protein